MCGSTRAKSPLLPGAGWRLWMRSGVSVNRGAVAWSASSSLNSASSSWPREMRWLALMR